MEAPRRGAPIQGGSQEYHRFNQKSQIFIDVQRCSGARHFRLRAERRPLWPLRAAAFYLRRGLGSRFASKSAGVTFDSTPFAGTLAPVSHTQALSTTLR